MAEGDYSLPTVEEFTNYSQWERRASNKPGISDGWSVGRGRAGGRKHQLGHRQDALLLAARLSHETVLVDHAPEHTKWLHNHCHGSTKKPSSYSPPRPTRRSTISPEKKVSKVPSVFSAKHTLLQMQLEARRRSIKEFIKYKADLLAANLATIGIIRQGEGQKNSVVQELLEKYRKSRGSVAALQKKTHRDREESLAELERTKQWVHKKEEELREEVREAETLLQARIKERDILKGFKEKEYMVNQVTIEKLRDEIKQHTYDCKESITTLDAEIAEEREKCSKMMAEKRREIEAWATEKCIGKMKRSVKEKGIQNKIMEKEIILHRQKAESMRQTVQDLQNEIGQLKLALRDDRTRMNPLMALEKCLPDTELHLNIPLQNLPQI